MVRHESIRATKHHACGASGISGANSEDNEYRDNIDGRSKRTLGGSIQRA